MPIRNEIITNEFSALLRENATNKLIVRISGMSGYIQTVLVPETAVMLIMEDMSIEKSRAIGVLEESHDIGDRMHPEDGDEMF